MNTVEGGIEGWISPIKVWLYHRKLGNGECHIYWASIDVIYAWGLPCHWHYLVHILFTLLSSMVGESKVILHLPLKH